MTANDFSTLTAYAIPVKNVEITRGSSSGEVEVARTDAALAAQKSWTASHARVDQNRPPARSSAR